MNLRLDAKNGCRLKQYEIVRGKRQRRSRHARRQSHAALKIPDIDTVRNRGHLARVHTVLAAEVFSCALRHGDVTADEEIGSSELQILFARRPNVRVMNEAENRNPQLPGERSARSREVG